jgi:hypothetical protein
MKRQPSQTAWARLALAAWMHEWQLDRRLRQADEAAPGAAPPAPCRYPATAPGRGVIAAGQIRLLPPVTPQTAARPVYVAVLAQAGGGVWQVAPFGRFATPALPGELALRRRALHLRVLCLWNVSALPDALLRAAWQAGRLSAPEQRGAASVQAALRGTPLPGMLARRVGPPLVHPLDPRHAYLDEERALWLDFVRPVADNLPFDASLRLAAERTDPYGSK